MYTLTILRHIVEIDHTYVTNILEIIRILVIPLSLAVSRMDEFIPTNSALFKVTSLSLNSSVTYSAVVSKRPLLSIIDCIRNINEDWVTIFILVNDLLEFDFAHWASILSFGPLLNAI